MGKREERVGRESGREGEERAEDVNSLPELRFEAAFEHLHDGPKIIIFSSKKNFHSEALKFISLRT